MKIQTPQTKQGILNRLAMTIFCLWSGYLAYCNILRLTELLPDAAYKIAVPMVLTAGIAAFSCLMGWILKGLKGWIIALVIFALAFAAKLVVLYNIAPILYSDYETFMNATQWINMKNYSFVFVSQYYTLWAYQYGFPWLISRVCLLFGNDTADFCLITNLFFAALCSPLIYGICRKFTGKWAAAGSAILFTLLPITIDLSAVYTNQHISLCFILLGIWCISIAPNWLGGILAGLSFSISDAARADAIVYVAAVIVAVILLRRNKQSFLMLLAFLAAYWAGKKLIFLAVSPHQPNGLVNNFPLYKFAVGLDYSGKGMYSIKLDRELFENKEFIADYSLRDAAVIEFIKEELSIGSDKLTELIKTKIMIQWTEKYHPYEIFVDARKYPTMEYFGREFSVPAVENLYACWEAITRALLFAVSSVAGAAAMFKKDYSFETAIFALAFMAFSVIELLIEVQYRYCYFVMPVLCIMPLMLLSSFKDFNLKRS